MSDTHRRYCAIKTALRQVIDVNPNSHAEKHVNTLTGLICGIVGSQHSQLPKIADKAPSGGAQRESRLKRFKRWVMADSVTYETYYLPFAQALLWTLARQPVVLVMDGSTVGRGCLALLLSVVYQRRALPLAWVVVQGVKGHFPEDTHCQLAAEVQPLLPPEATVIFVADGEFDGTTLQATLHAYGWHYVCRTAASTLVWLGDFAVAIRQLPVTCGEGIEVPATRVTAKAYGPVQVLAVWEVGESAPLYLLTTLTDPQAALDWYRQRFRIETFFSDQKSRGFQIDKSHFADPARLTRLLIAACLAYLWIVYLGTVAVEDGWLPVLQRPTRCDLSLFQLGLTFLAHCLNEDLPILVDFLPSLGGLLHPFQSHIFSVL